MPNVSEIMSTDVQAIAPQDTIRRAAQLMQELDVGALPVCVGKRLLGMLTDRDITVRGVAAGLMADDTCVSDVMSLEVQFCTADQDTQEVLRIMGRAQVRRLPVIDVDKNLVGIVSLGDMALRQPGHIDDLVREISDPGQAGHANAGAKDKASPGAGSSTADSVTNTGALVGSLDPGSP